MSEAIVRHQVADLRPHPLLERVAMLPTVAERQRKLAKSTGKDRAKHRQLTEELAGEWTAFVEDVRENGVIEPLKVTAEGLYVADGRHRLAAAVEAGLETVPAIVIADSSAQSLILSAVCSRRHFSKGALAYIAVLTHPEIVARSSGRPNDNPEPSSGLITQEKLAKRTGVSDRYLREAIALYREVEKRPGSANSVEAERSVFAGSKLGGVLSWLKARNNGETAATAPAPSPRADYDRLGPDSLVTLQNTVARWSDLKPETRESMVSGLRSFLQSLPDGVRDAITA